MSHEEKVLDTLLVLSERVKWVIRIGGALVCILSAGYAYQININLANATEIKSNTAHIESHIEQTDQLHKIMIDKWIKDNE